MSGPGAASPSQDRPHSSALNAARRSLELSRLADGESVDVLIIGGGITGTGIALDAASRGLRVALVEKHDLAFGTSRFSSKLVHGGLRYLASGDIGIARRSAIERGILMTRTAPHLVHAMAQLVPLLGSVSRGQRFLMRAGFAAGDLLRRLAGTPAAVLPRSRRVSARRATELVPTLRRGGLDGGLLAYDGQLIDDARLVIAVARTAAQYGAMILNYVGADEVTGDTARLTDQLTGESFVVTARAVINAAGVWAGDIDPELRLRPSRGTHLVFNAAALGYPTATLTVPVPGEANRFVFAMPQQLGRVYLGLTDEEVTGPIPDVAEPTAAEIDFLLDTVNTALGTQLGSASIAGAFAGLRPLVDGGPEPGGRSGRSADVSRRHAVVTSRSGVVSVIGGKLTEYRYMAEDSVDKVMRQCGIAAGPCRTRDLPLVGAPGNPGSALPGSAAQPPARLPKSLIARYGGEAAAVVSGATCERLTEPVAEGIDVIRAEFRYAITHEGALTVGDILDRRTRIGLVAGDRVRAEPVATEIVEAIS